MKPPRATSRTALAWRKPGGNRKAEANWHVVADRDGARSILASRATEAEAESLAGRLRAGGIEAALSVERDGEVVTGGMAP